MADDISILARDRDTAGQLADDTGTEAAAGAATGALAGGLLGGVAGWLVGIGALAIPGVGPIIAAGPIAAALGGAALGAAGGGIIGALTGAGVPEDEARYYDEEFRRGGIVVTRPGARPLRRGAPHPARVRRQGRLEERRGVLVLERDLAAFPLGVRAAVRHQPPLGRRRAGPPLRLRVVRSNSPGRHSHRLEHPEPTLRQEWSRTGSTGDYDTHRTTSGAAGTTAVAERPSAITIVTTWAPRARTRRRPVAAPLPAGWPGCGGRGSRRAARRGRRGRDRRYGRRNGRRRRRRDAPRAP